MEGLEKTVRIERVLRRSSQIGLVPYVRALQRFAVWLKRRPDATARDVIAQMTELGIWDVRMGYDPDKDPALNPLVPAEGQHTSLESGRR